MSGDRPLLLPLLLLVAVVQRSRSRACGGADGGALAMAREGSYGGSAGRPYADPLGRFHVPSVSRRPG